MREVDRGRHVDPSEPEETWAEWVEDHPGLVMILVGVLLGAGWIILESLRPEPTLEEMAGRGDEGSWGAAILLIALYFLPTIVARGKPQVVAVFLTNLFFGWTVIGWIVALIWAANNRTYSFAAPTKQCPSCAEQIQMGAVRCRYCGFDV